MSKYRFKGKPKITDDEVLQLFVDGHYTVDFDEGVVYGKNGTPLKPYLGGREEKYPRIRLYSNGKERSMAVAKAVWMAKTRTKVPKGFQVHHRDLDSSHNWWDNLFCLFRMDHDKLHRGVTLIEEEENDTPF